MFGFGRKRRQDDDDRLATLSRRLDDVESQLRTYKTEWLDTLDRIERVLGRLNKRAQRVGAEAPPDSPPAEQPPANGVDALVAYRRSRFAGPGRP